MSSPPVFSQRSIIAKALLYSPYNSFTLFVEDQTLEHLYLVIMKRMFPHLSFRRVFPVGGKDSILKTYQAMKQKADELPHKHFFIADLDLDPYLNLPLINDSNVIYLEEYCIENYFIEERAFMEAMKWKLKEVTEEIISRVRFNEWEEGTVNLFFKLHVFFIICRKYNLGDNVSISPYHFLENKGYLPDEFKIDKYRLDLLKKYCDEGHGNEADFNEQIEEITELVVRETNNKLKVSISGKYLLAGLCRFATHLSPKAVDNDLLLGHLVEHFDIESLSFVRERIIKEIS